MAERGAKRALLVAYDFPPQPNAAAVRLGALARHLPDFGWHVTVVTRPAAGPPPFACDLALTPPHGDIDAPRPFVPPRTRAPLVPSPLRAAVRALRGLRDFPDRSIGWARLAGEAADAALAATPHHALITSHGPSAEHIAGAAIARRHGLPWLADYRDLWSAQPWGRRGPLLRALERRMETRALAGAAAVTTVAPKLRAALQALLQRDDVEVLTNVVDDEAWRDIPDAPPHGFALLYAGRLHYGRRDPQPLFEAIARLARAGHPAGERVTFLYYGREGETLGRTAEAAGLQPELVRLMGIADRPAILRAERAAAVLVVLMNREERAELAEGVPSKVYEYAGARRPILAIGPPRSEVEAFLARSGLGVYASDTDGCEVALRALWDRFTEGKYRSEPGPSWVPFRAQDLARSVGQILDRITGH